MTPSSCLYTGTVVHRRRHPVEHSFRYRVFMLHADLDELPGLLGGRRAWSATRPAPLWLRRADHLGDRPRPLAEAVRDLVEERTGRRPGGPVRLLTHPRFLGVGFNPISLYYCHDRDGGPLTCAVAEVTNTPWGDQHAYVIDLRGRDTSPHAVHHGAFDKTLHVSPFLPLDMEYRWTLAVPGDRLSFGIACLRGGRTVLTAGLDLHRRELTPRATAAVLATHAPMPLVVLGGIYFEAFRLWRKGAPYHPHPRHGHGQAPDAPAAMGPRRVA